MKKIYLLLLILLVSNTLMAQSGKLLLVGGGMEDDSPEAWNQEAYQWAVNQTVNQRVAVITMEEDPSEWLPNYFINECNAVWARNFQIDDYYWQNADLQETYDSLITYDMVFLKGGDQYYYYLDYKNTKTQQAIEDIFNGGGVIAGTSAGMAILSSIAYTADNGSALPEPCIQDPYHEEITLHNDFLDFFPGYIFDTHFAERGRFARLAGFMANWYFTENENATGIGVDDMTALAIDENGIGTAYGTGAINIYKTTSPGAFSLSDGKLLADSLEVQQLLHGCTIDFNTGAVSGLTETVSPELIEEQGNYTIFASGGNSINDNYSLINAFVNQTGSTDDKVVIVTGESTATASTFKNNLITYGATNVEIVSATSANAGNADVANAINSAQKLMFLENTYAAIQAFRTGGQAGSALNSKLQQAGMAFAFVGSDSRFAGTTVIENYLEPGAAYDADLTFENGFNLLQTTVIMPQTYHNQDIYENTATAIPYSMVNSGARYGVWLTANNYLKYYVSNEEKTYFTASGETPVMILVNEGTETGVSEHTSTGSGNPRMIAGFYSMKLMLIDETVAKKVGNEVNAQVNIPSTLPNSQLKLFPNPANTQLTVTHSNTMDLVQIIDMNGKILAEKQAGEKTATIDVTNIASGIYIVRITERHTNQYIFGKCAIRR